MCSAEELSTVEAYHRRDQAQRDRLSRLLHHRIFKQVADLPYISRVAFEKWHATESTRIEHWFSEPSAPDSTVRQLTEILNAQAPDRQAAITWFEAHKGKVTADMLMQLVSETRLVAYSDAMRAKTKMKVTTANNKRKAVGWRWLEYQAGRVDGKKHSKNSAAPLLANEFHLSEQRMRQIYLIGIEQDTFVFPKGVDAARTELGLVHS